MYLFICRRTIWLNATINIHYKYKLKPPLFHSFEYIPEVALVSHVAIYICFGGTCFSHSCTTTLQSGFLRSRNKHPVLLGHLPTVTCGSSILYWVIVLGHISESSHRDHTKSTLLYAHYKGENWSFRVGESTVKSPRNSSCLSGPGREDSQSQSQNRRQLLRSNQGNGWRNAAGQHGGRQGSCIRCELYVPRKATDLGWEHSWTHTLSVCS